MESFITGSRVYGTATEESDIDLVILCSPEDKKMLTALSDTGKMPTRYGKLNLCILDSSDYDEKKKFELWAAANVELKARAKTAPVSREEAMEYFREVGAIVDGDQMSQYQPLGDEVI